MVIKVKNLTKCLEKFGDISKLDLRPVITECTRLVQAEAKELAPVDTGTLRRSIRTKVQAHTGVVYTLTDYAIYQEFGTYKMKAHPFMLPALANNSRSISMRISNYIRKQLKEFKK